MQGANDKGVATRHIITFAGELTRHNIPYRLIKFGNGNHSPKESRDEVFGQLFARFGKHL